MPQGAPLISGIIAGVIGGIVIGYLSGSHISVSGPAAGLTAIVLTQLDKLEGNYQAFLFCLVLAGLLQIIFWIISLRNIFKFYPNQCDYGASCCHRVNIDHQSASSALWDQN